MARDYKWVVLASVLFMPVIAEATTIPVKACIANMKQIDGAAQQWALERKLATNSVYSLQDPQVLSYLKGSTLPVCYSGGRYLAGKNVSDIPTCTRHGTIDHPIDAELEEYLPTMRQRFVWSWIIVLGCAIIISPWSRLPHSIRQGIMITLPVVMVFLVFLFWSDPPPGSQGMGMSAKPQAVFTGFGLVVSLIFARQVGQLRFYGVLTATCLFLLLLLFLA